MYEFQTKTNHFVVVEEGLQPKGEWVGSLFTTAIGGSNQPAGQSTDCSPPRDTAMCSTVWQPRVSAPHEWVTFKSCQIFIFVNEVSYKVLFLSNVQFFNGKFNHYYQKWVQIGYTKIF